MTLTREEIFARAGLKLSTEKIQKEHILLYNIDNIKEHTNNIQEQNCASTTSLGQVDLETSSPNRECEPLDSNSREKSKEEREPLDSREEESGVEPAFLGLHNVKRALFQIFKNSNGLYKLKVRLNLEDGDNLEFIAPLQKTAKKSNFMKHAANAEQASEFWVAVRKYVKKRYLLDPLLGKFHEKTGGRKNIKQSFTVEPDCYAGVWFDTELKCYRFISILYDLVIEDQIIDDDYLTEKQKKSGAVGQYLWINPKFDTRSRPMTAAERKKAGKPANYK
jgi:hypothetical protein